MRYNIIIGILIISIFLILSCTQKQTDAKECKEGFIKIGQSCVSEKSDFECNGQIDVSKGYYICGKSIGKIGDSSPSYLLMKNLENDNATLNIIGESWKRYAPCLNEPLNQRQEACNVVSESLEIESLELINGSLEGVALCDVGKTNVCLGEQAKNINYNGTLFIVENQKTLSGIKNGTRLRFAGIIKSEVKSVCSVNGLALPDSCPSYENKTFYYLNINKINLK